MQPLAPEARARGVVGGEAFRQGGEISGEAGAAGGRRGDVGDDPAFAALQGGRRGRNDEPLAIGGMRTGPPSCSLFIT